MAPDACHCVYHDGVQRNTWCPLILQFEDLSLTPRIILKNNAVMSFGIYPVYSSVCFEPIRLRMYCTHIKVSHANRKCIHTRFADMTVEIATSS